MATSKVTRLKTTEDTNFEMVPYASDSIKAGRLRIIVDGKTPLLTHNPESMNVTVDAKKGKRIPEPEAEAEGGTYRTEDGFCAVKAEGFRNALLYAAGQWKEKRTSLRSRLAHIVVVEDLLVLMRSDGTPISDYVIDRRRAIVQRSGIMRSRPRFDEWSAAFTFEYDPALVPNPKIIVDILQDAGGRVGVGDYRPACNGWFGRFTVRSYGLE